MSTYSEINGHITAKTEAGKAILIGQIGEWFPEESDVTKDAPLDYNDYLGWRDTDPFTLIACGLYKNLCRHIGNAVADLHEAGELRDVDIEIETIDGEMSRTLIFLGENNDPYITIKQYEKDGCDEDSDESYDFDEMASLNEKTERLV